MNSTGERDEIKMQMCKLYWLMGYHSSTRLASKRLLYMPIIGPVWYYGIQVWGTTKKANRDILQRLQNKLLRMIAKAPWYVTNDVLHRDLKVPKVEEAIKVAATNHERRLHQHTNISAMQFLDTNGET